MKSGKLIAFGFMAALAWQHQEMVAHSLNLARHAKPILQTHAEMRTYRIALMTERAERNGFLPINLTAWLESEYESTRYKRAGNDYFEQPYGLTVDEQRRQYLRSCGPDGRCQTADDIVTPLFAEDG
jgi:hypothetical protein